MMSLINKAISFFVVHTAWADIHNAAGGGGGATQSITFPNPLKANTFQELVTNIISNLKIVALPIVAILVIYAGYQFLTSGGSPEKVKNARQTLLYTAIGYALILTVDMLSTLIRNILNG